MRARVYAIKKRIPAVENISSCDARCNAWQAIKRKAKLAEAKEKQAIIKARMEQIESRVAAKLAGNSSQEKPSKGGWGFGWN